MEEAVTSSTAAVATNAAVEEQRIDLTSSSSCKARGGSFVMFTKKEASEY